MHVYLTTYSIGTNNDSGTMHDLHCCYNRIYLG